MANLTRYYLPAKQADGTYSLQEYLALVSDSGIEEAPTRLVASGIKGKALAERLAEALEETYIEGKADALGSPEVTFEAAKAEADVWWQRGGK